MTYFVIICQLLTKLCFVPSLNMLNVKLKLSELDNANDGWLIFKHYSQMYTFNGLTEMCVGAIVGLTVYKMSMMKARDQSSDLDSNRKVLGQTVY